VVSADSASSRNHPTAGFRFKAAPVHSRPIRGQRSPTVLLFSAPAERSTAPAAACAERRSRNSAFDATATSPSLTVEGLAAQRDSVNADNVDAHGWVLLIDPAAAAAGDPH